MSPLTLVAAAVRSLRQHPLRTALATLGIVIGVASVILMISLGEAAQRAVEAQIESLGTNQIIVVPGSSLLGGQQAGAGTAPPFSDADLALLAARIPGIAALSSLVTATATAVAGGRNWTTTAAGVGEHYLRVRNWGVGSGRDFTRAELAAGAKVALLGITVSEALFGTEPAIGALVRVGTVPFRVVGILSRKGQSMIGTDQDDVLVVPIAAARGRLLGAAGAVQNRVQMILIEARSPEDLPAVQREVERLLRERRRIGPDGRDDFVVNNMAEFIRTRSAARETLGLLLNSTAALALLVGGIGIMNIMLVSVTERTREIGIRIAVGADRPDILSQFLIEAVVFCLFGGLIGVALGWAGTSAISAIGQWPVAIAPLTVAIALGSAAAAGIGFGFYPAWTASRLHPVEALRHE